MKLKTSSTSKYHVIWFRTAGHPATQNRVGAVPATHDAGAFLPTRVLEPEG